jgi:hypothetical protein
VPSRDFTEPPRIAFVPGRSEVRSDGLEALQKIDSAPDKPEGRGADIRRAELGVCRKPLLDEQNGITFHLCQTFRCSQLITLRPPSVSAPSAGLQARHECR